jgi:hypothetical protein
MNDDIRHEELPLPEYDHIPTGHLPARISPLDSAGVRLLLDYERAHADRPMIVAILEHRLEALSNGAEPSGSIAASFAEMQQAPSAQQVTPAASGPPMNPPSHGDPTNPAQPR